MAMDEAVSSRLVRWTAAAEVDWEVVFTEQLPRIYNFFRYRVGVGADVEDLTSLTFEKAWRARHRYRRDLAGFTTWLLTIARNVAIDHFRSARPLVPIDEAALVTTGTTPEDLAADRSDQARLAALMADLPHPDREALALKDGAGLNNPENARLPGLEATKVGHPLHCAVAWP